VLLPRQRFKLVRGTKDKEHAMSQKLNTAIAVIDIDIGKNSFHVGATISAARSCCIRSGRVASIHDGPEHNTLQSEAGYIDARRLTASSAKSTCNARPDHTFGSSDTNGIQRSADLCPLLLQ